MIAEGLLDSNVVIAMLVEEHEHHAASLSLMANVKVSTFAVAAHSYAEAYSTLTRQGEHAPFRLSAEEAWTALESVRAVTTLAGLTPSQTFDVVRRYALSGGTGPRLYDCIIGEVAILHGISRIITWNTGHMRSLFPGVSVLTPALYLES